MVGVITPQLSFIVSSGPGRTQASDILELWRSNAPDRCVYCNGKPGSTASSVSVNKVSDFFLELSNETDATTPSQVASQPSRVRVQGKLFIARG
nr:hypothetical protein CFP56_77516 [Quercus suber]